LIRSRSGPDATRDNVREGRLFALTLAGGFLFVALLAMRRNRNRIEAAAFLLSAISLLAGLAIPGRLEPARRAWMKLGEAIGLVTTPIAMGIIYYVVLSPIAITRRLIGHRKPARDSHWHQRPPLPQAERMERQF
jgi:hypothetical protein